MRVGFEVTPLAVPRTGVGTYTFNLLQHLSRSTEDEILQLTQPPLRWPPVRDNRQRTLRLNKTLWMQLFLPWQLSRVAAEVCHFTNSVAPSWTPCPSIVTIHDATLWLFPQYHPRRRLLAMRPFIPLGVRRATAVITVSANSKRDLVRILKVPEDKVHIIYEAPGPEFRPLEHTEFLDLIRQRYGLPNGFILYVGTIEPRKNLVRLLHAFERLRRDGYPSHDLVLVGSRGWRDGDVFRSVERLGLRDVVRVLGYVPTKDLVALYNVADALVFPSMHEGFGLPVVEAMACGTPVVTSPNGSLAEVAGTAAEMVDPTEPDCIATGLRNVLSNPDRRAELRAAGLARAARFSWEQAAAQTRQVYTQVLRG
jgi:glycosyltransferase involved in cell wall biosynthesis